MKKRKNLGNIRYDIDGMTLDDLIKWAEHKKKSYPQYDSFVLEKDVEYGYEPGSEEATIYLYGRKEETKAEARTREATLLKKSKEAENRRRQEWEILNAEFRS